MGKLGYGTADHQSIMINIRKHKSRMRNRDWVMNKPDSMLDDDESDSDWEEEQAMREALLPRGRVIHYIPSMQMRLLRDFHEQSAKVKPVFLRSLAANVLDERSNLKSQEQMRNLIQAPNTKAAPQLKPKTERFNETLYGRFINGIRTGKQKKNRLQRGKLPRSNLPNLEGSANGSIFFQPERLHMANVGICKPLG
jgi:hypothetical protein